MLVLESTQWSEQQETDYACLVFLESVDVIFKIRLPILHNELGIISGRNKIFGDPINTSHNNGCHSKNAQLQIFVFIKYPQLSIGSSKFTEVKIWWKQKYFV